MKKVRFGVLGTAKIARTKVIPAMQKGMLCEVTGIASREGNRAEAVAKALDMERAYGSYEALLNDEAIDAVYIPLPNHLHVPWSIKALEAGKHVLCEKPIGLSAEDAEQLLEVSHRHPDLKVMEAFMYRHHPRWRRVKELVEDGDIGELKAIHSLFTYFNDDPENVRNHPEAGGGGLMDIGCYCISLSRLLFGREPKRALGVMDFDKRFGTDRLASGVLDFGEATSAFTCSTQCFKDQQVQVYGTDGKIVLEHPFNQNPTKPTHIVVYKGEDRQEISFEPCNQFTIQGERFTRAILDDTEVPLPLEDAVANMRVIDALRSSAEAG